MEFFRKHKQERETEKRERELNTRMLVAVSGLFVFAALIIGRLLFIQIIEAPEYQARARKQYESRLIVKAKRGTLYDRSMNRLASSLTYVSLAADPSMIENKEEVAAAFAEVFGKSKAGYLQKLSERTRFVWLERRISSEKAGIVSAKKLSGVIAMKEQNRHYENLAAQVLGFTDADNTGISGLEQSLNDTLKGRDGFLVMQRTASGKAFPRVGYPHQEAADGKSAMLTIDITVQAIAEDELRRGIVASGSSAGTVIIIDVRTGEILAIANYPDFDANNKLTYTPEATRNRAITDGFEPGSTFKLVQATAATELGLRKADDKVNAENGKFKIKNRVITDHEPLGTVTYKQSIAHSSNIVAAKTAIIIGEEKFYKYAAGFGFGAKTGIDLQGEVRGQLKATKEWSGITLPWMSQGYEVMVTPLQVLCAYAALANNGVQMQPFIIKKILSPDGKVFAEKKPAELRRVMKPKTAADVKEYFRAVVDSGTGISARPEGIDAAGKTGTAQKLVGGTYKSGSYASSFVGFFPVDKPRVAAIVMMDNPTNGYYGSIAAAPVFSRIASRIATASGEYQEKIQAVAVRKPSREKDFLDSVQTVTVPNVCGLAAEEARELLKVHRLDFKRENEMKGAVISQSIKAGTRVEVWSKVPLMFEDANASKMPSLVGLKADRAIYEAKQLGIKVSMQGTGGIVVSQRPKAGDKPNGDCQIVMSN
ncbi:MAG: PASTA domain-containing protein [Rhizobacter sp.]|nr:PASTA domain-containing protein [Chlorobiales bacterium]